MIASIIYYLSAQSSLKIPDLGFNFQDKLYHFIEYFGFGLTLCFSFSNSYLVKNKGKFIIFVFFIGSIYAFSDEYHQSFVPNRTADFFDWLFDSLGVLISIFIYIRFNQKVYEFFRSITKKFRM